MWSSPNSRIFPCDTCQCALVCMYYITKNRCHRCKLPLEAVCFNYGTSRMFLEVICGFCCCLLSIQEDKGSFHESQTATDGLDARDARLQQPCATAHLKCGQNTPPSSVPTLLLYTFALRSEVPLSFPSVPQQDPSLQLSAPPRQGHATRSWLGTADAHGWSGACGRGPAAQVNAHTRSKAGATRAECGTGTVPAPPFGNLEQQRGCGALNWSWRALQHSPRAGVCAHVQGQQLRAPPAAITRRGL